MNHNGNKIRLEKFTAKAIVATMLALVVLLGACKSGKQSKSATTDTVVKTARSYMGVPYAFGGTSRAGMDCSGLLIRSFEAAGIEIPRTSAAQSKMGKKVTIDEVRKGDLVFFKAEEGKKKVTHVGLVTEVRGKTEVRFIHSSTKLGVVENNLHSDHYRKIFLQARRII